MAYGPASMNALEGDDTRIVTIGCFSSRHSPYAPWRDLEPAFQPGAWVLLHMGLPKALGLLQGFPTASDAGEQG